MLPLIALTLLLASARSVPAPAPSSSWPRRFDQNSTQPREVKIESLTPHVEVAEKDDLDLRCSVAFSHEDGGDKYTVEWVFISSEREGAGFQVVAADGILSDRNRSQFVADNSERLSLRIKRRWDAIDDLNVEEHYFSIKQVQHGDQGVYICQIQSNSAASSSSHSSLTVASRHTLITILPQLIHSSDLQSDDPSMPGLAPTLGPITERFIVAKKGVDIVLECRDGDDNWVYWRKQGDPALKGTGRQLRLFRVDRWDSGLYYCSINSSLAMNVTLSVDVPPSVSAPRHDPGAKAKQALGHEAILTCRVEAIPVPQISWYQLLEENVTSHNLPSPSSPSLSGQAPTLDGSRSAPSDAIGQQPGGVRAQLVRRLHSGDDFSISIDGYRDGVVQSSLHIRQVQPSHFGSFRCAAKNSLGEDKLDILLSESQEPVDYSKDWRAVNTTVRTPGEGADAGASENQRISFLILLLSLLVTSNYATVSCLT